MNNSEIIYMLPIPKSFTIPWQLFQDNVSAFCFSQQWLLRFWPSGLWASMSLEVITHISQNDSACISRSMWQSNDFVLLPSFLSGHIPSPAVDKTWTHPHPNHFNHTDAGTRFICKHVPHPRLHSANPQHHNQWQYSSKAPHTSNENQKLACKLNCGNTPIHITL